jgi:hypothetical protein
VIQVTVFGILATLVSRKRPTWKACLGLVTWIMLALDVILVLVFLELADISVAI